MNRFVNCMFVACGAVVLTLVGGVYSSPIPKDAGKPNPTPDLKEFFTAVSKAVENEKWPAEADEKKLRDTPRVIFERALIVAKQKGRPLPIDFEKLTKLDVSANFAGKDLEGNFLIAKDVRVTRAKNSVIFASGNVQITSATNCVIIAQNVRCTGVMNCVVVAGDLIRVTGANRREGEDGSVLIAGQWIRATVLDETICYVLRPGTLPAPDEGKFGRNLPHPAIRTNGADNVIFLNAMEETGANGPRNCTYLPQKTPIAK